MPNSLLAGKIQGISSIHGLVARIYRQNGMSGQALTVKFPVRMNREFFETIRELNRRIREIPGRIREGAFRSRFGARATEGRRPAELGRRCAVNPHLPPHGQSSRVRVGELAVPMCGSSGVTARIR